MEKEINITQLREALGTLVDEVQYQDNKYVITRHGRPAAAVVPLHIYESWKANRERLFALIDEMQQNSGAHDPDELMELVLEAQQAVRANRADE